MIETNRVEYKAKLTDSLEKEIVAFLNYNEGGIIYPNHEIEIPTSFIIHQTSMK